MLDSFARIRDVIYKQQQALVEQRNYDQQNYKPPISEADDDASYAMDKLEGSGGFAGSDPKKRRGRAAPPGRCHSCNRAETPEWRRGPDGARTLCNACGLRRFLSLSHTWFIANSHSRLCETYEEDGIKSSKWSLKFATKRVEPFIAVTALVDHFLSRYCPARISVIWKIALCPQWDSLLHEQLEVNRFHLLRHSY